MKVKIVGIDGEVSGAVQHEGSSSYIDTQTKDIKNFITAMERNAPGDLGLLPPAVRWMSEDKSLVLFERPPMSQLIEFIPSRRELIRENSDYRESYKSLDKLCSYQLNIPWTSYLVLFDKTFLPVTIKVFARNKSIQSMDDTVGILPLLNFYQNGQLCNPAVGSFEGLPSGLGEGINIAYNMVWNSGFNFDLMDALRAGQYQRKPFRYLKEKNPFEYSVGERDAGHEIVALHYTWAQTPMEDLLQLDWPKPTAYQGGDEDEPKWEDYPTLSQVIDVTVEESSDYATSINRTFLVNLASSLV